MSEEKDGRQRIKEYRFNNTKESWHEFSLKFGAIADDRGYSDSIEGIVTQPEEKEDIEKSLRKTTLKPKSLKKRSSWLELQIRKDSETWLCQQMVYRSTLFKMRFRTN